MNYRVILNFLSWASYFLAAFLLLPVLVALIYGESVWTSYLISVGICLVVGTLFRLIHSRRSNMYAKEGFYAVALCWILFSMLGAIPFVLTGEIPNYVDALFETVSGFTTTGASILTDVESLSHASLFWRSFTHWIGGMGILVFMLAILPNKGNGSVMHLMRAESPGPVVGKLVPKVRQTALILYTIYLGMTILEIVILLIGKMPVFDAFLLSFGSAGTGGFAIKADGLASYTMFQQGVITVSMILFGVNFTFYYLLLTRKLFPALKMSEVRTYFLIILVSIFLITLDILPMFDGWFEAAHHAAFQVGSIITTTGYATTDFNLWPGFSKTILVTLMFIGACAGSTGGGIKVSRIILFCKGVKNELSMSIHPRGVRKVKVDGQTVESETIRSVNAFFALYIIIFVFSVLFISLDEKDLITNFTAIAATLNNIGPGLEVVGPLGSFASFSIPSKLIMSFDMLAGRLELIPILMLFAPPTWKK